LNQMRYDVTYRSNYKKKHICHTRN